MSTVNPGTGSGGPRDVSHYLPDAPVEPKPTVPPGWRIDDDWMLFEVKEEKQGGRRKPDAVREGGVFVGPAALVTAIDRDTEGRLLHTVGFLTGGELAEITVPATVLAGTGIVKELSEYGLGVTTNNRKQYVQYFADYLRHNEQVIPHHTCYGRAGWLTKSAFALGTDVLGSDAGDIVVRVESGGEKQALSHFHTKGDLDEWRRLVMRLPDDASAWVLLYAVFTPLLHDIVQMPGTCFFELVGDTSVGKTTALRLAASAFGFPGDEGSPGLVRSWKGTNVARERYAALTPGLPQFLDELSTEYVPSIESTVYMLANGQPKGRGTLKGLQRQGNWNTLVVSSGEGSIAECSKKGGIRARLISVTEPPLGEGDQTDLVEDIRRTCMTDYGHAARKMVEYLVALNDSGRAKLCEFYEQYRESFASNATSNLQKRAASYFGLMALAGHIVHQLLNIGQPNDFWRRVSAFWERHRNQLVDEAPLAKRAHYMIIDWYLEHRGHFDHPGKDSSEATKYGSVVLSKETGEQSLIVIPSVLNGVLRDQGFDPKVSMRAIRDAGNLIHDTGNRLTHNVTLFGTRGRHYHIRLPAQEEGSVGEDVQTADS
jgi:putative DNA primase/helicase